MDHRHIHPASAGTGQVGSWVSLAVMNMVGLTLGMGALGTEVQVRSENLVQDGVVGGNNLSQAARCNMLAEAGPLDSEKFGVGEGSQLLDAVE